MRIIIAGSRQFNDYYKLATSVLSIVAGLKYKGYNISGVNMEIISGTANGADKLGERFAEEFHLKVVKFPADWSIGRQAGYVRNVEMAEYAKQDNGVLIAYWNGSPGTRHMIDIARKKGLIVEVIEF